MKALSIICLLSTLILEVVADKCPMPDGEAKGLMPGDVVNDGMICAPTGEDHLTFAMLVGMTSFGVGGTTQGSSRFLILDHSCKVLGHYYPANKCGNMPWKIEEPFLHYMLTLESAFMDVGDPSFTFTYANGLYKIGENHCTCQDSSSGVHAEQSCKCAFPIDGEPE